MADTLIDMTIIFEGMPLTVRTAEHLIEVAKAKRALSNGHSPIVTTSTDPEKVSTIQEFMKALPVTVIPGFEALLKNKGSMSAEELWPVFDTRDNSQLGARFISPIRRVAKSYDFNSEQILKKLEVINSKGGKTLKYKIPAENVEQVRQGINSRDTGDED